MRASVYGNDTSSQAGGQGYGIEPTFDEEENDVKVKAMPASKSGSSGNCCSRLRYELACSYSFFSISEFGGKFLNVEATFAPSSWFVLVTRLVFFGWTAGSFVQDLLSYPPQNRFIYMGFLTHWGFALTIVYQALALLVTMNRKCLYQPVAGEPPSRWVRLMWGFYSLCLPLECIIVLIFWTLDFQPGDSIQYRTVFQHGGVLFLLFLDGNFVGRIPLRVKHFVLVESMGLTFLLWSFFDSYFAIGDGDWPGEAGIEGVDDLLYDIIDWQNNTSKTVIVLVVIACVVTPLLFMACWFFSLWTSCCRFDGGRRQVVYSNSLLSNA